MGNKKHFNEREVNPKKHFNKQAVAVAAAMRAAVRGQDVQKVELLITNWSKGGKSARGT